MDAAADVTRFVPSAATEHASDLEGEAAAEPTPPTLGADTLKQCSLNRQDGLRQYSLTPHPSMLPKDFLDQQRAESAVLLNKCLKSKIIRFVSLEVRLSDGSPYSFTPNKPIIKPPLLDANLVNMSKRASWQISLSPNDPIRAKNLPAEGIVLVTLKNEVYGGQYDYEDFVSPEERKLDDSSGGGIFVIPLYSSAGSGDDMHPIFNHVQISVQRLQPEENETEGIWHVTRVSLVHIPAAELADRDSALVYTTEEPSSPPIIFPILASNFMDTASAQNKRKYPPEDEEDDDDTYDVSEDAADVSPPPHKRRSCFVQSSAAADPGHPDETVMMIKRRKGEDHHVI